MADLPRRNGWMLAEHAGEQLTGRIWRLLNCAAWDERAGAAAVRDLVVKHLGDELAVAVFEELGQEKKGT